MKFWGKRKEFVRLPIDQLQPGMHISLAERWLDHPFLLNEFTIETEAQIDLIRAMGMTGVLWCAAHSSASPKPLVAVSGPRDASQPTAEAERKIEQARRERKERDARVQEARLRTQKTEKAYRAATAQLRAAFAVAYRSPSQAVALAREIIDEASRTFSSNENVSLMVLSDSMAWSNLHTHGINVMLLSLLQSKLHGLDEATMKSVALGALFHDLGKLKLPDVIRMTAESKLNRSELAYLKLHTELGAKMTFALDDFDPIARSVIGLHHENWDGSGYPFGLVGDKIPLATRLVAIADRYDELSNPQHLQDAMTPHQALVHLYKHQPGHFAPNELNQFIKALGVFPPGTIVELSNGTVGMVMSVNRDNALRPQVTLWQEGIKPQDAPMIDLSIETEVSVTRALRAADLDESVREFLDPRVRTAYFYSKIEPG